MARKKQKLEENVGEETNYEQVKVTLFTYGIGKDKDRKIYRFLTEGLRNNKAFEAYKAYFRGRHIRSDPQLALEEMTEIMVTRPKRI